MKERIDHPLQFVIAIPSIFAKRKRTFGLLSTLFVCFLLLTTSSLASDLSEVYRKGNWGLGFYGAGGKGLNGGEKDVQLFWTGVRYKRILTNTKGKSIWRGNLEYGVEFVPLFLAQQEHTVYGGNFSPLMMRWNFQKRGSHIVPFFEWGGGMLFTSDEVPARSSRFNFTPQAGFGFSAFNSKGSAITFQVKYFHVSNAGFQKRNPGINSLQMQVGYEWMKIK